MHDPVDNLLPVGTGALNHCHQDIVTVQCVLPHRYNVEQMHFQTRWKVQSPKESD